jgi:hypothetical protein
MADRVGVVPVTMEGGGKRVPTAQHQEKVNFIVGCDDSHGDSRQDGEIPEEEASDLFPTEGNTPSQENSSSSNLNSMFALAEKRRRLR